MALTLVRNAADGGHQYEVQAGLTLQPNVQYIRHPGGGASDPLSPARGQHLKDATVLGLRTVVKF
ncbi:MAG: carbohydrate porin [Nitrobacter sp.]